MKNIGNPDPTIMPERTVQFEGTETVAFKEAIEDLSDKLRNGADLVHFKIDVRLAGTFWEPGDLLVKIGVIQTIPVVFIYRYVEKTDDGHRLDHVPMGPDYSYYGKLCVTTTELMSMQRIDKESVR